MKIRYHLFKRLNKNLIEKHEINNIIVEFYNMNKTRYFKRYSKRGIFEVWTSNGQNYKVLVEKSYFDVMKVKYEPEVNAIWIDYLNKKYKKIKSTYKKALLITGVYGLILGLLYLFFQRYSSDPEFYFPMVLFILLSTIPPLVAGYKESLNKLWNTSIKDIRTRLTDKVYKELTEASVKHYNKFNNIKTEIDFKELQNELLKEQMRAQAAFISPSFRGLYEFQQEYLPKKFYSLGNSLYYKIKENGFFWILDGFNNGNQTKTLMNETNSQIDIIDYSELKKSIVKINIPDIKKVLVTSYSNTISDSIYMCFNLNNEDENMYFTAERSDQIVPAKYVLCGRDKDMRHLNYGSLGLDKEPFIEDIPLAVIENIFQISQNTNLDKKGLNKANQDNRDISSVDIKFVSKKYSEEEIKNLKSELFFANHELDSRNLEKGYLRNSDLYREVGKSRNPKPDLLADTFNSFGLEYYHLNNFEKAISFLQKARKIYDSIFEYSNISTYNNLAIIYNEIGNYLESDKICNEAIRINTLKYGNDTKENDRFNEIISENKKFKQPNRV